MKICVIIAAIGLALALSASAKDVSVKLNGVHLCCQSCVKGAQTAIEKVPGVTLTANQDEDIVSLSGPDKATVQKAVDALVEAGYLRQEHQSWHQGQGQHRRQGRQGEITRDRRRASLLRQVRQSRQ